MIAAFFVLSGYQTSIGWGIQSNGDMNRTEDGNEEQKKAKVR
jgi:hypothetical protein